MSGSNNGDSAQQAAGNPAVDGGQHANQPTQPAEADEAVCIQLSKKHITLSYVKRNNGFCNYHKPEEEVPDNLPYSYDSYVPHMRTRSHHRQIVVNDWNRNAIDTALRLVIAEAQGNLPDGINHDAVQAAVRNALYGPADNRRENGRRAKQF